MMSTHATHASQMRLERNEARIDSETAVKLARDHRNDVVVLATVLTANVEESSHNAHGPSLFGQSLGGSSHSAKARPTRITGVTSATHIRPRLFRTTVVANAANYIPVASLTGANGTGLGAGTYSVPTGLVNIAAPDISSSVVPLPTSASTTTIPNPFNRGYINSFNFTVEQEFKGFVLQTVYIGARDVRPLVNMNINASAPGTGAAGGLISAALGRTYTANINSEVPFKDYAYDSLQTKVTRRIGNGSSFGFVWT